MKKTITLLSLSFLFISFIACNNSDTAKKTAHTEEGAKNVPVQNHQNNSVSQQNPHPPANTEKIIEVEEEFQLAWKAVKLEVLNKAKDELKVYEVKRGEELKLTDPELSVMIRTFIPHFTMGDGVMTSINGEPENPAVHIIITENKKEIFNTVIFKKHPDYHAFTHDSYRIILLDYIAADK